MATEYPAHLANDSFGRLIGADRITDPKVRLLCLGARPMPRLRVRELLTYPDVIALRDACGRRRSKVTLPGHNRGVKPKNFGKRYPADPPTDEEVSALMDACPKRSLVGLRNRALIALLRGSGLRISEALALVPSDLDFEHAIVLVQHGKGDKRRRAGINRGALDEVGVWITVRAFADFTHEQPVFPICEGPTRGGRMRSAYFRAALKHLADEAGVLRRVAPHQLRHSLAVSMARNHIPVPLISRALGHSNIATTATYLSGIADVEVFDVMAGLDWGTA